VKFFLYNEDGYWDGERFAVVPLPKVVFFSGESCQKSKEELASSGVECEVGYYDGGLDVEVRHERVRQPAVVPGVR
jgi:hypothetical protein